MNIDKDKIDEYTLALLYLVVHERHEGLGARAWKGFDWDTLSRLHEKGYISNPAGKTKSVGLTEEDFSRLKNSSDGISLRKQKRYRYQSLRNRQRSDGTNTRRDEKRHPGQCAVYSMPKSHFHAAS